MSELVSVIITTYKREPEIVIRAIQSVLSQTYNSIELILVDDSPSDYDKRNDLKETIAKIFAEKVKYIQHAENQGACAARNTGLEVAKGEFVAFLDDDDEWLPEKIEKQIRMFDDETIALVYCGQMVVDDVAGTVTYPNKKYHSGYIYEKLIFENFIGSTSFPLIRKKHLLEIGGFDKLMKSAQDYDVWLRLSQKYQVNFVSESLVKYHIHGGDRISSNHIARVSGQERLIDKNIEYLTQNPVAYWWRLLRLSHQYALGMQLMQALGVWRQAVLKCPVKAATNIKYLIYNIMVVGKQKIDIVKNNRNAKQH